MPRNVTLAPGNQVALRFERAAHQHREWSRAFGRMPLGWRVGPWDEHRPVPRPATAWQPLKGIGAVADTVLIHDFDSVVPEQRVRGMVHGPGRVVGLSAVRSGRGYGQRIPVRGAAASFAHGAMTHAVAP